MTEQQKTNGALVPLAGNLKNLLEQPQWGNQRHLLSLTRHWPKLVGDVFAHQSLPAYFRRDELWIYVRHSLWMQQMQLAKMEIMAKIKTFLHQQQRVSDLRWTLQPVDLAAPPAEPYVPPPTQVDPAAEREFRAMAETIADVEARQALLRFWRRMETLKRKM
ncbi:MAG: Protein of unknown function (DUF721) [Candidatus Electronema aureum]|uniref:DUF721 domain-containing protein n=1 Tax=Candidatus Electronema aureum TaxID=2005002 RepID=A0A521G2P9_9BACT|nr:MAG: Protein of unknown function (DUF721) [Candidatus Electronema aureum]